MVERLFHWLPGAKFVLGMGTAGVAWMGRAAASFTESSLQPWDGWAGGSCGHGQPLFLWESFGVRPRFLTCFCLFFFFLLLNCPCLTSSLRHFLSQLFPFCSCFCSYHSSSFCSISSLFPLLTSLFLSLFPLAAQPLTTFSLADNFPRAQPQQLRLHGHLHNPEVLGWGTLSSLAPSMVLGDGQEPPSRRCFSL